ncbi:flavodoxin family protein [Eubacterium limosum]|uniref:flavodoxin family protein n=1 Tax=Eubacterium limosum TaxID=1736 RepID=UPI001062A739|nr:flavodoxin family protein [Eubacterium limosum]
MKRIMCISGSPRKGNTNYLIKTIEKHLSNLNYYVKCVMLDETHLEYCDGCLSCDNTGVCHIQDGMNDILEELIKSDCIIFATPTRWALMSASLKNFIDRTNPLANGMRLMGKKAVLIAIGQCEGEEAIGITKAIDSIKNYTDDAGIEVISSFAIEGMLNPDDLSENDEVANYICDKIELSIR